MLHLNPPSTVASELRPVALRMRQDLIVRERHRGARKYYLIKDPIQLTHHQLWEEEFSLLQMLDGKTSIESMKSAFRDKFPGARLDPRRLQVLHGQFHRNGLVLSDHVGQAAVMQCRQAAARSQRRWGRIRGWLAIRFRGMNPDRFFEYLDNRIGWVFDSPALECVALFIVATAIFFSVSIARALPDLSSMDEYLNVSSIALVYLTFICLKILHEVGHGLACKHFGGECNEMGLMLLVFTPCLYCNVTDSWMIESKWKRAMTASAGIFFEWIAASVCAWLWWFSNPGILHSLCFYAILIGSIGTLLFNGNPLLKYDGYFVLSDLLDRPNLAQQAQHIVSNRLARFYLRNTPATPPDFSGRSSRLLGVYGLLAMAYRWFIAIMILFVVYNLFQLLRLEIVGAILVCSLVVGAAFRLANWAAKVARQPGRLRNLRTGRVSFTLFAAILVLAAIIWLPLPTRLHSHVYLEARNSKSVYVTVDGTILQCLAEGAHVRAGDSIATLASHDLKLDLVARRGELSRQQSRLVGLESRRGDDPLAASKIPTVQESIAGLELEVNRLESNIRQLTLRAPTDGVVLAPVAVKPSSDPMKTETWSGTPMDEENRGCLMTRGTKLCDIGDASSFQGSVYLTQAQVELVRPGQTIMLRAESLPNRSFRGVVADVGTASRLELPSEIAAAGILPTHINPLGKTESKDPVFVAKVEILNESLQGSQLLPLHRSLGRISIHVEPQSLGSRLARFAFSSFAIDPTVQPTPTR